MKKRLLVIIMLLAGTLGAGAAQVSVNDAKQKAAAFCARAVPSHIMCSPRASSSLMLAYTSKADASGDNCFYVFNRGVDDGYVIVSADDRASSVLGYADSGTFDENSIPSNMRWWLDEYQRQIQYLARHPLMSGDGSVAKYAWTKENVGPLLSTCWNQLAPYNGKCPAGSYISNGKTVEGNYTAGCVAAAMAQIMRYHRWPEKGIGSHSYVSAAMKLPLSSNFGEHTYDWANMPDYYDASATAEQKDAVSLLMSDCGIAVNMNYNHDGHSSSGAFDSDCVNALINNFGYDKGVTYKNRYFYSLAAWDSVVHAEIVARRPVLYGGNSSTSGHAFVCDGCNSDGYYHINWGGSGLGNGYFLLSALFSSYNIAVGGNVGYNYNQDIVCGIQRQTANAATNYEFVAGLLSMNDTVVGKGEPASLPTCGSSYCFSEPMPMYAYGYQLCDASGRLIDTQMEEVNDTVRAASLYIDSLGSGRCTVYGFDSLMSFTAPSTLSDGKYRLYPCYKETSASEWKRVRIAPSSPQYVSLTVDGTQNRYVTESVVRGLKVSDIVKDCQLYSGRTASVSATIANSGDEYIGDVHLNLYAMTRDSSASSVSKKVVAVTTEPAFSSEHNFVDLESGASQRYTFRPSIGVAAGDYILRFVDDDGNVISGDVDVTVNPTPSASALTLPVAISLVDCPSGIVPKNDVRMRAVIRNTGGFFSGNIAAGFVTTTSEYVAYLGIQPLLLETNQTDTLEFSGSFSQGVVGTTYMLGILVYEGMKRFTPFNYSYLVFTVGEPTSTSVNGVSSEGCRVYPLSATDVVNVESVAAIRNVSVYSLTGAQVVRVGAEGNSASVDVSSLSSGCYILKAQTDAGSIVKRIVKR